MKKTVSVCMTAVMALSLLAGGAVQAYALSAETAEPVFAVAEENCISSSWKRASDPALTEKVRKVFDQAFDGLEGVSYTQAAPPASVPSIAFCARRLSSYRAHRKSMWWSRCSTAG